MRGKPINGTENKTHFFPENNIHVITSWLPYGTYGAYRDEIDEGKYRGFGATRLEAIADLVENVCDGED